jgi:hypothetical protein
MYKSFYDPIAQTICNEFMAEFKCKLLLQFFTASVLADITIPNTAGTRRTQQIFGNINGDMLKTAQGWAVERNVASFFLEMLRTMNNYMDQWIEFFIGSVP